MTYMAQPALLSLIQFNSPEGQQVFWHSSSHLLGLAIEQVMKSKPLGIRFFSSEGPIFFHLPGVFRPSRSQSLRACERSALRWACPLCREGRNR